jgi:hypothetical protein
MDDIKLNNEENIDYNKLIEIIDKLELGYSKEDILNKLKQYKGHLNLTLRSLLCNL